MRKLRYSLIALLLAAQLGSAPPATAAPRKRSRCSITARHTIPRGPRKAKQVCRPARTKATAVGEGAGDSPPTVPTAPTASAPPNLEAPVEGAAPQEVGGAPAGLTPPGPTRFFSPTSIWNTMPPAEAEADPESAVVTAAFVAEIQQEMNEGRGPGISTTAYGVPIFTVGPEQPDVMVKLTSTTPAPALQEAWSAVPLPEDAEPSEGTDGTLVVWQPSTDRLWEFWHLARSAEGWQAGWGGAMEDVSGGPGVYGPGVWSNSKPWWGSSASSLSIVGGLITLEDLERGRIEHALAIAVPQVRAGVYSSPAQRTDGRSTSPVALPEGAHLRLDPSLNLAEIPMPPLTRMIAEAAQRYGIFVRDGARVAHFFAQDPVGLSPNPYTGVEGYFGRLTPGELLASFPWQSLQLLRMEPHIQH